MTGPSPNAQAALLGYVSRPSRATRAVRCELFYVPVEAAFLACSARSRWGVSLGPRWWRALVAFPENRLKAVVPTLCLALGLALPSLAAADARHVENRCPRLTAEEYDELDARIQLLLSGEAPSGPLPAIVCADGRAWVEWRGQRLRFFKRGTLVDEAVDLIEGQLHDGERGPAADARAM